VKPDLRRLGFVICLSAAAVLSGQAHPVEPEGSVEPDEELVELQRRVELEPGDATRRVRLGSALFSRGQVEQAREQFEEALRIRPRYATAHYNLGVLLAVTGRDEGAVEHYRKAIAADPGLLSAHFNLANALRRLGEFDEALRQYRNVVQYDPRHAGARTSEALTLIRLHRWDEARRSAERSMERLPDDLRPRHILVRLLAAAPDPEVRDGKRAAEFAVGLATGPSTPEYLATLAMVAAESGDYSRAVDLQRRVLEWVGQDASSAALAGIREDLARYESDKPCRRPWRDEDPVLSPPPLAPPTGD